MHRKRLSALLAVTVSITNAAAAAVPAMAAEPAQPESAVVAEAQAQEEQAAIQPQTASVSEPAPQAEQTMPESTGSGTEAPVASDEMSEAPATDNTQDTDESPDPGQDTQAPETPEQSPTDETSGQDELPSESTQATPSPTPTPQTTPTPTPQPTPAPETDIQATPSGNEQAQQNQTSSGVTGSNTYSGPVYGIHAGASDAAEETVIIAEDMPGAYEAAGILIENGYSEEAASGIVGALIAANNGHDIPDPSETIQDILERMDAEWNSDSESGIHLTNIGYGNFLVDNAESLKEASAKEAAISFTAFYQDRINGKSALTNGYSSVNELTNNVAADCVSYAFNCYRGFFNGDPGEDNPVWESPDVRVGYTKTEKIYLIAATDTNIYEEADDSARVVGTLEEGGIAFNLTREGDYYYIESGDVRGFIKTDNMLNPSTSKAIIKEDGEWGKATAVAIVPLSENAAASFNTETVYLFSMPTDENIALTAQKFLADESNEGQTNEEWFNSVLEFYGMDTTIEGSDPTDTGKETELSEISEGNIVIYTEPKKESSDTEISDTEGAENSPAAETDETEKPQELYAVYTGDGTFTTVTLAGDTVKNAQINEKNIVTVLDMTPEEERVTGTVTNHDVPYYNQGEFGGTPFNTGSVASDGCGVTAFAMVASYVNDAEITPADVATWAMANGANTVTNWGAFKTLASHYGVGFIGQFTGPLYGGSASRIADYLSEGYIVIGSHTGGYFNPSGRGHYIVYTGIDENGNVFVNDPGDRAKSEAGAYDRATAFSNCKQYWVFEV